VIDAGGEISFGYGKVIMDDVLPDPGTVVIAADSLLEDTYLDERIAWAYGEENDEADSDWWITSYAFCVDR
jgi:hypothetical protein